MYANDNNGMFPDASADWQACLNSTGFPIDFECPSFTAPLGSSFFYVPGYGEDSDPRQIVAYENPANHPGEGGHILYRDGSVRWVPWAQFTKEINGIKLPDGKPFDPYARPVTKDEPEDEDG